MAAKIVFHLGPQKTGTTSIQALMVQNRARLLPRVGTVVHPRQSRDLFYATEAWLSEKSEDNRLKIANVLRRVQKRHDTCETVIISEERLISHRLFSETSDFIEDSACLIPLLAELIGPERCTFVYYYRNFQSWIASAYRQDVKRLSEKRSFSEWVDNLTFDSNWPSKLESKLDPGINLFFVDMTEDAQSGPLGRKLLEIAGVDSWEIDQMKLVKPMNERLPDGATAFMREINLLGLKPRVVMKIRQVVLDNQGVFNKEYDL